MNSRTPLQDEILKALDRKEKYGYTGNLRLSDITSLLLHVRGISRTEACVRVSLNHLVKRGLLGTSEVRTRGRKTRVWNSV